MFKSMRFATVQLDKKIYENDRMLVYKTKLQAGKPKSILKILKPDVYSERDIVRLHHGYSVAKNIHSPYVAKVFALVKDMDTIALAMEDIDAESLGSCLRSNPPTLMEGLELALSICKGLGDIHKEKVVHKNINPANILWNRKTGEVKIIDFGIAGLFGKEETRPEMPSKLEGNFFYMSPEQTGRMNRSIDYRTDFYSLGITLYEIFTGSLPFSITDSLGLIHSHIAKTPSLPELNNPNIPPMLSKIIMKLLQKEPENRYQSAYGIEYDLSELKKQLQNKIPTNDFTLTTKDICNQFNLSTKLFGRNSQATQLKQSFKKVCEGNIVLSLVKGYSGVGKTSLVQELYRPLAIVRGRYISGKFDQYKRNVPYSAIVSAFHELCDQILTEPAEKLIQWKEKILSVLGKNGQVILEILPNFINIIGPQPKLPPVDPQSAKNRFKSLFLNFISVLCNAQEPMVLFLDDLQWADQASLDLLKLMLVNINIKGLHLVGAYRDNEVAASHPLLLMLDEIKKAGQTFEVVSLDNLSKKDITHMVAATLLLTENEVLPLAALIYKKTLGNAFYATEFFKNLYMTGLLTHIHQKWVWDLKEIERKNVSENVVEFISIIIKRLAPETQRALGIAACIGSLFDLETLSIALNLPTDIPRVMQRLTSAIAAGVIIPENNKYKGIGIVDIHCAEVVFKFQHDRVQQAAYSLIEKQDRENIHYCIGNLLLRYSEKTHKLEERLFEIVAHFQQSIVRIKTVDERIKMAELLYQAGMKARLASAYEASSNYFLQSHNILHKNGCKSAYALYFNIMLELAKSYYLNGKFSDSSALYSQLIKYAETTMDGVKVKIVQMEDYHLQGNYKKAIEVQKQALVLLDDPFPHDRQVEAAIICELEKTHILLANRDMDALFHSQELTSADVLAKLRILVGMWMSAYLVSDNEIVQWSSIKMTNLTLEFGNSEFASFAYGQYGYICVLRLKKFKEGHQFGMLGISLAEFYPNVEMRGKVYFNFALCVNHWSEHLSISTDYFRKAYRLSIESGDWTYAVYAAANIISNLIIEGKESRHIESEGKKYFEFLRDKADVGLNSFFLPGGYVPLLHLLGRTDHSDSFDCEYLNEKTLLRTLGKLPIVQAWFYSAKIRSLFMLRNLDAAMKILDKAEVVLEGVPAQIKISEAFFYACLIITTTFERLKDEALKQHYREQFEKYKKIFEFWAEQCPANFLHKWLLIRAEEYWFQKKEVNETLALYDLAFEEANIAGYRNLAALAQELKGRFWFKHKQSEYAFVNIRKALQLYQNWGALAKVEQLNREFPNINSISEGGPEHRLFAQKDEVSEVEIDFQSVYKIAQSLSQNLEWDALISSILIIVMENMGANRSVLFLDEMSRWIVGAFGRLDSNTPNVVINNKRKVFVTNSTNYPCFLVNTLINSPEIINIDSSNIPMHFRQDPFFKDKETFSIICAPIQSHGKLIGIIYLENTFVSQGFNRNRVNILKIFLSQISISLENARLFANASKTADLYARAKKIKMLNTKLQHTLIELKRSNHELEEFAYVASHDLKAPLRVIDNASKWLEEDLQMHLTNQTKKNMDLLRGRIYRMEKLLDDLLEYSRIGRIQDNRFDEIVAGSVLLSDILILLSPSNAFTVTTSSNFADIHVKRMPLQQILMNLVGNAIKHHNKKEGHIEVTVKDSGTYYTFAVKDDGPGIAPQYHEQIFKMFQTLKPKDQLEGSGMGLALVRKNIEVFGGTLKLMSSEGKGSVFSFTWPKKSTKINKAD